MESLIALAGVSLAFLAILGRIDRRCAEGDRREAECDRNAAAELYRRAAAEKRETAATLKAYLAALEERDKAKTTYERLGLIQAN